MQKYGICIYSIVAPKTKAIKMPICRKKRIKLPNLPRMLKEADISLKRKINKNFILLTHH